MEDQVLAIMSQVDHFGDDCLSIRWASHGFLQLTTDQGDEALVVDNPKILPRALSHSVDGNHSLFLGTTPAF